MEAGKFSTDKVFAGLPGFERLFLPFVKLAHAHDGFESAAPDAIVNADPAATDKS